MVARTWDDAGVGGGGAGKRRGGQHLTAAVLAAEEARAWPIVRAVCTYYDLAPHRVLSRARDPLLVEARTVAMRLLVEDLGMGPSAVGRVTGRDHSTVLHHMGRLASSHVWTQEACEALADLRAQLQRQLPHPPDLWSGGSRRPEAGWGPPVLARRAVGS